MRKAILNFLPVMRNLSCKWVVREPLCALCGAEEEKVEHCLLCCEWTKGVWHGSSLSYQIGKRRITTFDKWLLSVLMGVGKSLTEKKRVATMVAYYCWQFWKQRCATIYGQSQIQVENTIKTAELLSEEWILQKQLT